MAELKLQQIDDKGAVVHSSAATLAQADVDRFFAAFTAIYGPVGVGQNEDGTSITRNLTAAEVWAKFTGALLLEMIAKVQAQEVAAAQAAALAVIAPTPVNFTPVANP